MGFSLDNFKVGKTYNNWGCIGSQSSHCDDGSEMMASASVPWGPFGARGLGGVTVLCLQGLGGSLGQRKSKALGTAGA